MTLKEILDNVLLESGMATETVYAANGSDDVKRLLSLANRSAATLGVFDWQALRKIYTFTLTTAEEYELPTDYRALMPDTAFGDSYVNPIDMRTNPTYWAYLKAGSGSNGARFRFRLLGDVISVHNPQAGETVRFEYLSNAPIDPGPKQRFTADTDTWLLDDDMLTMDLIWRYKRLIGLPDWQDDRAEFRNYYRTIKGQQAGAKTISANDQGFVFSEPYTDLWPVNS